MATTPRKRTTPRRPSKKPAPFQLVSADSTEFDEREPLFSIDGTVYSIPVRVPTGVALEYAVTGVEVGDASAIIFALNYTLGQVGRRALMMHRGLTDEQLQGIVGVIRAKFDGALAGPKGKPASA